MASQLVSDVRRKRLMHCATSNRKRGSVCSQLSHPQSYEYHRIEYHSAIQVEGNLNKNNNMGCDEKGANKHIGRQQVQMLHTLGFSYLASSFIYIITKVKAFYNGFLGDAASESIEAPITETYFSVPVIPN
ncbi:hypothetical protein Lalb_Chr16g0380541 [Lupinus albus]|uniref:Uncharacterized protein n=1 Tax=Lupinus albus TaxID=3870 RepID=A0A6A4P5A6_LUPAL|nr:hypothetical protein Lalb_Chr16g0380541 [Lupinus albus]